VHRAAPTADDPRLVGSKARYARASLQRAMQNGMLSPDEVQLILEFVTEVKGAQGITVDRANKIVFHLVNWRVHRFVGPYQENTVFDLYEGIEALAEGRRGNGQPFKQNTRRDYITMLKRFYIWLIENGHSSIPLRSVQQIRPPRRDTQTKTAEQMLSETEIMAMIRACMSSRDRAIIATIYEGGFRIKEIRTLTWKQVKFDEAGVVINVNVKTERPRYVRLVSATSFLATWRNDYPFSATGNNLVFITRQNKPLQHGTIEAQIQKIARRAGVTKHITPHLFRHSRVTHLMQQGYSESLIKLMIWGNINTNMFETYAHLTNTDIDNEIFRRMGIVRPQPSVKPAMTARQCPQCAALNPPVHAYCSQCGHELDPPADEDARP